MKGLFLAVIVLAVSACATQPAAIPASTQEASVNPLAVEIAGALAKDKNVLRAYLALKEADQNTPVYVLAPIFENEYPEEAIGAAYDAFYQLVPNGKLELWLVPKHEYKKHFARVQPIYVRP